MNGYKWILKVVAIVAVIAAVVTVVIIYRDKIAAFFCMVQEKFSALKAKFHEEEFYSDFSDFDDI